MRVAYGRIAVRPDGMCEIDIFVQEVDGMRIQDECDFVPVEPARYAAPMLLGYCIRRWFGTASSLCQLRCLARAASDL